MPISLLTSTRETVIFFTAGSESSGNIDECQSCWDLNFNIGASKSNFDLSNYKVKNLELHTGATSTRIKLGDRNDSTDVTVEMGAASLILEIPKTTGCSVSGDMVMMSKDFPGLSKKDSGLYERIISINPGRKFFVRVNGGVSSIRLIRY